MIPLGIRGAKKTQKPRLTHDEKKLAHQHLDDLTARKNGDSNAAQRLSSDKYREHLRDDGWTSLDIIDEKKTTGITNVMRLLYKEVNVTIEWKVIQNH